MAAVQTVSGSVLEELRGCPTSLEKPSLSFEFSLVNSASFRIARATQKNPVLIKDQKKQKQNRGF